MNTKELKARCEHSIHYLHNLYPDIYDINGIRYDNLAKPRLQDSLDKLERYTER